MSGWGLQAAGYAPPAQANNLLLGSTLDDPADAAATQILTSGSTTAFQLRVYTAGIAGNLIMRISTAGATLTAAQNLIALYSKDGQTQLGVSADQSVNWTGTGNIVMPAVSGSWLLSLPYVWVVILSVGTTPPTIQAGAGNATAGMINVGAGGIVNPRRAGVIATVQTTLPATFNPVAPLSSTFMGMVAAV